MKQCGTVIGKDKYTTLYVPSVVYCTTGNTVSPVLNWICIICTSMLGGMQEE